MNTTQQISEELKEIVDKTAILPINVEDLLCQRNIESARIEFKASWDDKTTANQVTKTMCAFANDFYNINGGYIIIGVAEENGQAVLPLKGIDSNQIDHIQKQILNCSHKIEPRVDYRISPEKVADKYIVVIWIPASDNRPHQAPDDKGKRHYYIREGCQTIEAKDNRLTELISRCSKIPFDARQALAFTPEDLRFALVREFLHEVKSDLINERDELTIYRKMKLIAPVNSHQVPLNFALLFFSDDPEKAFRGARIEVAYFPEGKGSSRFEERVFRGNLIKQLKDCLDYLQSLSATYITKVAHQAEAVRQVRFPYIALRESLVNALYHRSYEYPPEPIKIEIFTDSIHITSYPGPAAGLKPEHFCRYAKIPTVEPRNRWVGELLKRLNLAEQWHTGIQKIFQAMEENGSPLPRFEFDEERTYFTVILPAYQQEEGLSPEQRNAIDALKKLIETYLEQGLYSLAEPLYQQILTIQEQAVGKESATYTKTLVELAELYNKQGNKEQAIACYEEAITIREKIFEENDLRLAKNYQDLANIYRDFAEYDKAIPLLQKALIINEKQLGENHPSVAISLNSLALLYKNQERYDEAFPLYQRSLAILEKTLSENHPNIATSLNNLAMLYHKQERYEEALPLYQRSLAIQEQVSGANHPDVAQSLNNLALLYHKQERYKEALPLYQRSLAILEKSLGTEHPTTKIVAENYAWLLEKMSESE